MSDISTANGTLKDEFKAFLSETNLSQRQASINIGKAPSAISMWLNDKYPGTVSEVEDAVRRYMKRERNRRILKKPGIVRTENYSRIWNVIAIAHESKFIGLIVGDAGTGKTVAAEEYNEANPANSIYILVNGQTTKKILLQQLAGQLRINAQGSDNDLAYRVAMELIEGDYVVIVDQADYLKGAVLEMLRHVVMDKGHSGLVLIGLSRLVYQLDNIRDDHEQITSRIGIFYQTLSMKDSDASRIMKTLWPDIESGVTKEAAKFSAGSYRVLVNLIENIQRTLIVNKLERPDLEVVDVATQEMFKRAGRKIKG
jgi:DNA transposition AAA+ family ATPase